MIYQLCFCALIVAASAFPQQAPASTARLQPQRFAPVGQPAAVRAPVFSHAPTIVRRPIAQAALPADYQYRDELRDAFTEDDQLDLSAQYSFGFDVNDNLYNNIQGRTETRDGQTITGSYTIVDSDGFIRRVNYQATPEGGFEAKVVREPTDIRVIIPEPRPLPESDAPIRSGAQRTPASTAPLPAHTATVVRAPSIQQVPTHFTSPALSSIQAAQLPPAPIYSYSEPGVNVAVRVPSFIRQQPVTISRSVPHS